MADIFTPDDFKWYARQKLVPPSRAPHGTEQSIAENLGNVKVQRWTMEGNMLIGETSFGKFGQPLPTDMICKGIDDNGKPLLEKVVLSQ